MASISDQAPPAAAGGYAPDPEGAKLPLGRLLRRRWFLLLFGLLAGAGGGYAYFTTQPPIYQSSAEVTVSFRGHALPMQDGGRDQSPGQGWDPLEDYVHRIATPPLVRRAVEEHGLADLPRFRGGKSPLGTILQDLEVERIEGTRVLRLTYPGLSPEETEAVVDALVATFIASVREDERSVSQEAVELITKATREVRADLEAASTAYRDFQARSPLERGAEGQSLNPYAAYLLQLDAARDEARLELTNLVAEIASIRRSLAEGGRRQALTQMASLARRADADGLDPAGMQLSFEEQNLELLLELDDLRARYGSNHPDLKRLEARYDSLRKLMQRRAGLDGEESEHKSFLDTFVDSREERAKVLETQVAELERQYRETEAKADTLRDAELEEAELRGRMERHAALYDALVDRVAQLDLLKEADQVRVAELVPAGPGGQTPVQLVRNVAAGGMLGLALAFGLAYLLETGDQSFQGPEELRAEFGLPLLGHVAEIPAKALRRRRGDGPLDPSLLTVHRPKSRLAESYRAIRAGLLFSARSGVKVIQVTSADPGDGKSTVAANLAVTLGRSGKQTVLVDCDLRRPRVAKLFGLPKEGPGVTDAIADPDRVDELALESGVDGLRLLPCRTKPDHPAELLSSEAFEEFVEVLRHKFDFVVLDSPPVLAVSDPAVTAPAADGVVLVIRLSKRTRRKVRECLSTLERAGANVLGLVPNAVRAGGEYTRQVESGYYGSYGYGGGRYYSEERAAPASMKSRPAAPEPLAAGGAGDRANGVGSTV